MALAGHDALTAPSPPAWDFACPDWEERLFAGRSLVPELPLFEAEAERGVKIFNRLRIPDIVGQPTFGEAAGDWFRDIVRVVFGSLDPVTMIRHVPELFALIGKKNSKTTNSGGLMVTALLMNRVPHGEYLFIGPTQEIANLAFDQAAGMIATDPDGYLQKRFHVRDHLKMIVDRTNGAHVKIKTFDMRVMTGSKPIGVLLDELHIMGSIHYASRVIGQIRGALESKRDSFLLIISTQSDEPPAGAFRAELQYARAVRDGRIRDGRMLPILYEFPEKFQTDREKPWADPRHWPAVMPNLGRSLHLDAMIAGYRAATEKGEEEERRWASQHLNIQIGLALHADRWAGADYWEGAAEDGLTLDVLLERAEVVTVGIDGGGLDDLLGLTLIGRCRETRRWLWWSHAWAQPDVLERRKEIAPRLRDFEKAGDLTVCAHPTQDLEEVADIVERVRDAGLLPERNAIGLDAAGVSAIVDELAARGVTEEQMVAVAQGWRLSGAIWGAERKLKDGTLRQAGQALMTWCVGNAKVEQRGNAVLITKQAAGKAKIDPLHAGFNAFQLMSRNPVAGTPPSPWEDPNFKYEAA